MSRVWVCISHFRSALLFHLYSTRVTPPFIVVHIFSHERATLGMSPWGGDVTGVTHISDTKNLTSVILKIVNYYNSN